MNKSPAYFNRKTTVSSAVLAFFESSHHPVSVKHILDYLNKKNLFPNKTTVYRIIDKLLAANYITELTLRTGGTYYETVPTHPHHHFFCVDCKSVFCVEATPAEPLMETMKTANPLFQIHSHDLNLYGRCSQCPSNKSAQ